MSATVAGDLAIGPTRRSIKWVRFFLLTSLFLFFNQISVSCCSFSFFLSPRHPLKLSRLTIIYPRRQPSFYLLKPFIFFPFLFLLNLTGRLWTSFFLIRRNLGSTLFSYICCTALYYIHRNYHIKILLYSEVRWTF